MIMLPMPRQVGRRYEHPSLSSSIDEIDQQELLLIAINIMTVVHINLSLHLCNTCVCFLSPVSQIHDSLASSMLYFLRIIVFV